MATRPSSADLEHANTLTMRERIAMILLVMMFKVLKPTGWTHEIDEPMRQIMALLGTEKK